jgi:hypothetical protein
MFRVPTEIQQTNNTNLQHQILRNSQAICNSSGNSGYLNHILNTEYTYGKITETVDIIKVSKKEKLLNIQDRYHIYLIIKNNLHVGHAVA